MTLKVIRLYWSSRTAGNCSCAMVLAETWHETVASRIWKAGSDVELLTAGKDTEPRIILREDPKQALDFVTVETEVEA